MYGAYIPLDKLWEKLFESVNKELTFVPEVKVNEDLKLSFIVMCEKGAFHNYL